MPRTNSGILEAHLFTSASNDFWSPQRRYVASIMHNNLFEATFGFMVIFNLALAVVDTDYGAQGDTSPSWIALTENILLLFYVLELSTRVYVLRSEYFFVGRNVVDFLIVLVDVIFFFVGLVSVHLPNVAFLRVLRLFKLIRAFKILKTHQELYIFVEGLYGAFKATFFGCVFIAISLPICAIIGVDFLRPLPVEFSPTCSTCPDAFGSVYYSMLTIVETVIVGDTWGELFLPYAKRYPLTLFYIIPVYVILNFLFLNLILAVIVDAAAQARHGNTRQLVKEREAELWQHKLMLAKICREMDQNASGTLTKDELVEGFHTNFDFKLLMDAMSISPDELEAVFSVLDRDMSGDCGYDEFAEQLYKMQCSESYRLLSFVKSTIVEVRNKILQDSNAKTELIEHDIQNLQETLGKLLSAPKEMPKERMRQDAVNEISVAKSDNNSKPGESLEEKSDCATRPQTNLPIDGDLHAMLEQISSALGELKSNCEKNFTVLTGFKDLHSRMPVDKFSSCVVSCNKLRQPGLRDHNTQNGTGTFWQSKLAQISQEVQGMRELEPVPGGEPDEFDARHS